ncbi:uncharacterized protein LOC141594686 [Silene latifolia]|uniref:uncharacterized protein LOC141594686 n=1 Tax=Silene latifolia TaxID=37657 RepID=UPI003D770F7F
MDISPVSIDPPVYDEDPISNAQPDTPATAAEDDAPVTPRSTPTATPSSSPPSDATTAPSTATDSPTPVGRGFRVKFPNSRLQGMSNESFQSFISGSPSLQKLVIVDLLSLTKPIVSVPNIDNSRLVLMMSLNFPNLETLYTYLRFDIRRLDITDISSVRYDIYIKYLTTRDNPVSTMNNFLLIGKFQGVEVLRLSRNASKLFLLTIPNVQLLQNRWKRIDLELDNFCEVCLSGFRNLVRSSKYLEDITIYTTKDFKARIDLQEDEVSSPDVLPQVKTITVHCQGICWKNQLQLIEALLKSATVLDKLLIVPMKHRLGEAKELE